MMKLNDDSMGRVSVSRRAYNLKEFDKQFKRGQSLRTKQRADLKDYFSLRKLLSLFTIFDLIAGYDYKRNLIADLLSGLTVGVMHIPAALAYGALTSLNPVNGLYSSFYPGITYVLFGTSRQLSVGTFAVISLMVYSTVNRMENENPIVMPFMNTTLDGDDELAGNLAAANSTLVSLRNDSMLMMESLQQEFKLKIATSLAFWCGLIQVLMAILQIGNIYKYFSLPLLRGFTTAAAFHGNRK